MIAKGVRTSYALRARGKQRGKERVIAKGVRTSYALRARGKQRGKERVIAKGVRTSYALRARGKQRGKERVITEGDRVITEGDRVRVILPSVSLHQRCTGVRTSYALLTPMPFLPRRGMHGYARGKQRGKERVILPSVSEGDRVRINKGVILPSFTLSGYSLHLTFGSRCTGEGRRFGRKRSPLTEVNEGVKGNLSFAVR